MAIMLAYPQYFVCAHNIDFDMQGNSRSTVLLVIAKENNLDIEFVEVKPPKVDAEYLKLNPLARVPTFVGSDGLLLTEVMAIAIYCRFR